MNFTQILTILVVHEKEKQKMLKNGFYMASLIILVMSSIFKIIYSTKRLLNLLWLMVNFILVELSTNV